MKLKLKEIEIVYSQEPLITQNELLKSSESTYRFSLSEGAKVKELIKRANQMILKFLKQTIDLEKKFREDEDAFYLTINHNIKQEDFDTITIVLGYDVNPEKVLKTIFKERNKILTKSLKQKNISNKDHIFISLLTTKGMAYKYNHIASLGVVYYYTVL